MRRFTHSYLLKRQQGVYAVEWAIVFPVFFLLIYVVISYGLTFLVRESMQFAVEDGARAALRYQPSRAARIEGVKSVVQHNLDWLPAALQTQENLLIDVTVCRLGGSTCSEALVCGPDPESGCLVHVAVEMKYGSHPFAPSIPGLNFWVPEKLKASASLLVDSGGL